MLSSLLIPFFASWPDISKAIANVSRRMNEDVEKRPELQTLAPRTILSTIVWNQRSLNDALWRSRCAAAISRETDWVDSEVILAQDRIDRTMPELWHGYSPAHLRSMHVRLAKRWKDARASKRHAESACEPG
jgi:hypothetical protein